MATSYASSVSSGMDDKEILVILRDHIPKIFDIYHETNVLSLIKMIVNKN